MKLLKSMPERNFCVPVFQVVLRFSHFWIHLSRLGSGSLILPRFQPTRVSLSFIAWVGFCLACCDAFAFSPPEPMLFDPAIVEYSLLEHGIVVDEESAASLENGRVMASRNSAVADPESYEWQALPDGLLWRSYLAAPQEPRISMVLLRTADQANYWDATLGGRVGLLRYGTLGAFQPRGWQWDLEGAVMTRLDLGNSEDVVSMDYRFGTEMTRSEGPWAMKFGYFHISSHVGDEFLERNPGFARVNYVTESMVFGLSRNMSEAIRLYGETAYAFHIAGGADRFQFQMGAEYSPMATYSKRGAPFAAINMDIRQAVDFDPAINFQTGWQWKGGLSGRSLRLGLELYDGHSTQFQFFDQTQQHIGFGAWFDY